jgi:hypothetical protein
MTIPAESTLPVLIISYARAENVQRLISQLSQLGNVKIFLAIDGPRDSRVAEIQLEMIESLNIQTFEKGVSLQIWQRKQNLGVAVSVISAIDWFFSKVEFGVILEDDLQPDNSFFSYAHHYLRKLVDVREVFMVSGTKVTELSKNEEELSFTTYPQTWGWGTWRDRWIELRASAFSVESLPTMISTSAVDNFWHYGSLRVLRGRVDTWDIPIANYMRTKNYFSLLPPVNLVSNVGNDAYATHTFDSSNHLDMPTEKLLSFPQIDLSQLKRKTPIIDRTMERFVFRIRRRHVLLPLYTILDSRRKTLLDLEPLATRLARVQLPD